MLFGSRARLSSSCSCRSLRWGDVFKVDADSRAELRFVERHQNKIATRRRLWIISSTAAGAALDHLFHRVEADAEKSAEILTAFQVVVVVVLDEAGLHEVLTRRGQALAAVNKISIGFGRALILSMLCGTSDSMAQKGATTKMKAPLRMVSWK